MNGITNHAFEGTEVPFAPKEGTERVVAVSVISVTAWPGLGREAWTNWFQDTPVGVPVTDDATTSKTVKIYLGVFGCLMESVILAGSIFGWASMVYVLEDDGTCLIHDDRLQFTRMSMAIPGGWVSVGDLLQHSHYDSCQSRLAGARSSTLNGLFTGLLNTSFAFQAVKMAHGNGFERKYSMMILSAFWVLGVPLSWLLPYHKISLYPRTKELRVRWEEDKRTLKVCVFSPTYVLFLVWFSAIHVCWQMHTNSYNNWISHITHGNNIKVSFYTDFQAWSLISALLFAPVAGFIIDYTRSLLTSTSIIYRAPAAVAPAMLLASTAALCMKGVSLWEQDAAIFASIVFFIIGKSFTYTSAIAFLSTSFPTTHFGKLFGMGYGIAGLSSLACYVYLLWASNSSMGFIPSNILILGTVMASYSCPLSCIYNYTRWRSKVFDVVIHDTKL